MYSCIIRSSIMCAFKYYYDFTEWHITLHHLFDCTCVIICMLFLSLLHTVAAYPAQVNQTSIGVEFSEDTRNGFFGYAVANLSWEASPGTYCMYEQRQYYYDSWFCFMHVFPLLLIFLLYLCNLCQDPITWSLHFRSYHDWHIPDTLIIKLLFLTKNYYVLVNVVMVLRNAILRLFFCFHAHNADIDCVTSYQVNVYPDREECGGIPDREQPGIQFFNINRVSS